ncbi:50S ribosomal protein L19e domain-containing protein, partial [Methanolobus psychrotolerans]|uniref:50S ribosomal protein L19e domain-containing protein n=1 Tax=Methanolobus psychrotolerans TaxID=1874706 RepID=UPI0037422FF1
MQLKKLSGSLQKLVAERRRSLRQKLQSFPLRSLTRQEVNKMTDLSNQKRIASEVLGCGLHRVWLDPEASADIAVAITRADIR